MIETPNGQGVSHNRYDQFNVGPEGLLLNNISGNFDTSQLGGIIPGNANLTNGAASLILNEVVSPNPSTLAGYLEVAGARADVIVANPYGITCNGCGFLNMDRMTLATGTPTWEAGVFTGLGIDGGAIAIGENGAAARDTLRFDLLSRRISVAGAVEGQRIRVVAGRNDVVYLTDEVTPRAADGRDAPELAIDSTVLGGMYAGSISITSTESGVGVRAPQNMAATTGDMHITADGRLVMGRASAQGQMQVQSASSDVTVQESLAAREALEIEAARAILVETDARIVSEAALVLQAGTGVTLGANAELAAVGDLGVDAGTGDAVLGAAARVLSHGDVSVQGQSITAQNDALMLAGMPQNGISQDALLSLQATDTITLSGAQAASGGDIAADARVIAIAAQSELPAGRFVAQGDITLATEQLAATGGQVVAAGDLSVTSGTVDLVIDRGSLQAGQSASLAAAQSITNAAQILAGDQLRIIAGTELTNSGDLQAQNLLHISASGLRNSGSIDAFGGGVLLDGLAGFDNTGGRVSSDIGILLELSGAHQLTASNWGVVESGGWLTLQGAGGGSITELTVAAGTDLLSNGQLTIRADDLTNDGTLASVMGNMLLQTTADLTNRGQIYAGGDLLAIRAGGTVLNDGGTILAMNALLVCGTGTNDCTADRSADRAGALINRDGGLIETFEGDIYLAAATILNERDGPARITTPDPVYRTINNDPGGCSGVCLGDDSYNYTIDRLTTASRIVEVDGASSSIVSGADIILDAGRIDNSYSLISAAGNIAIDAGILFNLGDQSTSTESRVRENWRFIDRTFPQSNVRRIQSVDPAVVTETILASFLGTIEAGGSITGSITNSLTNGVVTENADDRSVGASTSPNLGVGQTAVAFAPGSGGLPQLDGTDGLFGNDQLFVVNSGAVSGYLIETRADFINLDRFLGSDYFLDALGYDGFTTQLRLGDPYVEAQFIRNQITGLTGGRFVGAARSEQDQIRAMYDNAIDAARNLELTPGIALTPDQIAALTDDIIWVEEALVNGQTVLVPRVYLASATSLAMAQSTLGTATIRAGLDINLLVGSITNSGAMVAGRDVALVVQGDLANLGGMLGAQNVLSLDVAGTLTSLSGTIAADMVQIAAGDIVIATASERFGDETSYQDVAGRTATITAGTELVMLAERGIVLTGAEISSGGAATLVAGDGITVGALALEGQVQRDFDGGYYRAESLRHQASQIVTGAELTLFAQGGDIVLEGATLDAGGAVGLIALDGNVLMEAVADYSFSDLSAKDGNFFGKNSMRDQRFDLTHQVSQIAGAEIDIFAAGMITAEGTRFTTAGQTGDTLDALQGGDLRMTAASGSILVSTPTDIAARSYQSSSSMLGGLISSSTDIRGLNTESLRSTARVAGMIDLTAAGDLTLVAVDFEAAGILRTDVGGETFLLAAIDTDYASSNVMRNNGVTITTTTQEDYTERATFNELRAAGFAFDEGSPVTFDAIRDPRIGATHAAALVNPGEANMAIAAMFLGDTDPATGPPSSGTADDSWRTDLDIRQIALPGVQDGPGYGYIAPLLERDSTENKDVLLIDQHFYDQQVVLNPAFKALVSIAVSAYVPGLGGFLGLDGAAAAAATAFGNSMTVGMIDGAITGNMDIGVILETAAFSGVTSGLTAGINLPDNLGLNQDSLFGRGNLSIANLAEGGLDATITAALRTGVYGDDFVAGFSASLGSSAAGLLMADMHNVIGSGVIDGRYSEGDLLHVTLHALVGCAAAELQGADCGAGAVGGAVSALYAGEIDRNGGLEDDQRVAATRNAEMIGAVAGYLVSGGKGENVSQAAAISQSAFQNNYLTYAEAQRREEINEELWACRESNTCSQAQINELWDEFEALNTLDAQRDAQFKLACIDTRSANCALAFADLETAFESYTTYIQDGSIQLSVLLGEYASGDIFSLDSVADGSAGVANLYAYYKQDLLQNAYLEALRTIPVSAATGTIDLITITAQAAAGNVTAQQQLELIGASILTTITDPVGTVRSGYEGVVTQLNQAKALEAAGDWQGAAEILGQVSAEFTYVATGVGGPVVAGGARALTWVPKAPKIEIVNRFGPLNEGPLPDGIASTFRSGTYNEVVTTEPTTLYRVIGDNGNPAGGYWTRVEPQGPLQSVIDSALDQNWGNSATTVVQMEVPAGTRLFEGVAAPQRGLVGGGNQIYFDRNINPMKPEWIKQ
ncbi:two-partner secretion domain-containing protein [Yoonia vestfoldensis]|uniref:two-partner secretion domain-containing protein n=1 Tax=Yoonia vestfoldensis TaxID=245188 RepID=UPI002880170D|nr:filamentous hemagglutinin N-terminal domain-containing protein [Yoonia vestfoldensis]